MPSASSLSLTKDYDSPKEHRPGKERGRLLESVASFAHSPNSPRARIAPVQLASENLVPNGTLAGAPSNRRMLLLSICSYWVHC